jgi:hypothetical protein
VIWIGVDAHKQVHQALALGAEGPVGERTIPNTPQAWAALLEWAQQWPQRIWAVEGAWFLGRGLAQYLAGQGERVHEVNGRWTAARRRGMRSPGKSDRLDARSVATLLREEASTLPRVYADEDELAAVQLWSRTQAELTKDLTRLINRLHDLLLQCDPEYKATLPDLTTKKAIAALRTYTAPGSGVLAREREALIRATAAQLALLDEQDRELRRKLERVSKTRFSPPEADRGDRTTHRLRDRGRGRSTACGLRRGAARRPRRALPARGLQRRRGASPAQSPGQPPAQHGLPPDRAHAGAHLSAGADVPVASTERRPHRSRGASRAQATHRSSRVPRLAGVLRHQHREGRGMTLLT